MILIKKMEGGMKKFGTNPKESELWMKELQKIIQSKKNYIEKVQDSIVMLEKIKADLDSKLRKCNIGYTVGNVASIIGTGLLFTPFFFIGLGVCAIGAITSIASNFAQIYLKII
jgi:hypothetical protein